LINSSNNISPGRVGGRWSGNRRATSRVGKPARPRLPDLLVVIHDFDVARMATFPCETNTVLIVDSHAILSASIPA
jgi:hypothetical protein